MRSRLRKPTPPEKIQIESIRVRPNSPRQVDFFASTEYEVLYGGAAGGGKLQPLDALIYTPFGPKKMGDLKIGDAVNNPDGTISKIIQIHEHGEQDVFTVKFDDNASCEVGLDHLWTIREARIRRFRKRKIETSPELWEIVTTKTLIEKIKRKRIVIPLSHPVQFTTTSRYINSRLPVRPYTLGAFLGDGHIGKTTLRITTADEEVIKNIQSEGYKPGYRAKKKNTPAQDIYFNKALLNSFKKLSLAGKLSFEKFIPKQYLHTPLETRWSLINGLMDTDGYCDKRGHCSYTTTSQQLALDVQYVTRSLGFKANITSKIPTYRLHGQKLNGHRAYTVWIKGQNKQKLFFLKRKTTRSMVPYNNGSGEYARRITSIAPSRKTRCRCITVNHPNGLYVTNDFIVTHNSWSIVIDPLRYVEYTDFTATIWRRTYPQLLNSIIPYCHSYYPHAGGVWNEQKKTWTFPSGAKIRLGYMEHEESWQNYQGDETCGQYFDELTTFHWKQYQMLGAWNRSRVAGIPPYRRSSSNPGGLSHTSVKNHFVDSCPPVKDGPERYSHVTGMWWQPMKPGPTAWFKNEIGQMLSRRFIPAKVFDNEDLLAKTPNYIAQLLQLPPHKRKAYLEGDWDVFEGMFFDMFNRDTHVIEPLPMSLIKASPNGAIRGAIDYGQRTVLEIGLRDYEGNIICFAETYSEEKTPSARAEQMAETLKQYELDNLLIKHDTNMSYSLKHYTGYDKAPIQIFNDTFKKLLRHKAPTLVEVSKKSEDSTKYRIACNEAVKEYLSFQKDPKTGEFIKKPMVYITSNCSRLIETLPELIHNPDSPGGLDFDKDIGVDDPYDAFKYMFMDLRRPSAASKKRIYKDMDEYMEQEVFSKIHDRTLNFQQSTRWDKI